MPEKKSPMESAYDDAMGTPRSPGKKPNPGKPRNGIIKVDPRESDGTFNKKPNPVIGVPKQPKNPAKKPSPAKGMPY